MRHKNLEQFYHDNKNFLNSEWIKDTGLSIYVRMPLKTIHSADIVIANMSSNKPSKGNLRKFLDKYEGQYNFLIENVLNERLIPFFLNRNYRIIPGNFDYEPPSLIYSSCWHIRDNKKER